MPATRQVLARERSLWIAWLSLVASILVLGGLLVPLGLGSSLGVAAYCAYLLLLLRCLRGLRCSSEDPVSRPASGGLGPWGYIWRSYVVLMVTLFPLFWATVGSSATQRRPWPAWIPWVVMLVLPPPVTWLVFGHDRMAAVRRLLTDHRRDGV